MTKVMVETQASQGGMMVTQRSLRVLAVYGEDYPWDIRINKLLTGFMKAGHQVTLVCRNHKRRPLLELVDSIPCRRLTPPTCPRAANAVLSLPAFFNPVWRRAVQEGIRSCAADVVMVRDLPLAPIAQHAAAAAGLPLLIDMAENHPAMWATIHANYPLRVGARLLKLPSVGRALEKRVVPCADMIFVVVDEMRERLVALGAAPERVRVVSNTPEMAIFAENGHSNRAFPLEMRGDDRLHFLYIGYVDRSRGLDLVLRALPALRSQRPSPLVHIIGSGDHLAGLRRLAASLGVEDAVRFHGWLEHRFVPEAIRRADIGLIPHLRTEHTDTTIPNKLFDYMACARPALVSDARPLARVVAAEQCGVVFRDRNVQDLAAKMRLCWDRHKRAAWGASGRRAVLDRYHWGRDLEIACEGLAELGSGTAAVVANR